LNSQHPDVQTIIAKIEDVTRVPRDNYESFQILRYDLGQKYVTHHDSSEDDNALLCGPRILTFFLYLSDVEEGGETDFPTLGISVKPEKGKAVLWPSTFDSDPSKVDPRTKHQAKPVIKGRKFGANSWIHLYDYVRPNLWGCTGTFD
jgi:prolyl 4-hydroxylase